MFGDDDDEEEVSFESEEEIETSDDEDEDEGDGRRGRQICQRGDFLSFPPLSSSVCAVQHLRSKIDFHPARKTNK